MGQCGRRWVARQGRKGVVGFRTRQGQKGSGAREGEASIQSFPSPARATTGPGYSHKHWRLQCHWHWHCLPAVIARRWDEEWRVLGLALVEGPQAQGLQGRGANVAVTGPGYTAPCPTPSRCPVLPFSPSDCVSTCA